MKAENMNDLINKVKSSNQQNVIQKIVPIPIKEIEEIQFSFYMEKELYKKLKLQAFADEQSMKQMINNAIRKSLA